MTTWQTSGVGSLPFVDSSEAIQYVCSAYTIPFYPQLVKHERFSKSPFPQMLQEAVPLAVLNLFAEKSPVINNALELNKIWEEEISQHIVSLPGVQEFSQALSSHESQFFKLQLIGPNTATSLMEDLYGRNMEGELKKVIVVGLKKFAERLRTIFNSGNKQALLFLDEPLSPSAKHLNMFQLENTVAGVHCCGKFNFARVVEQFIAAYLSFDLNQHSINESLLGNITNLQKNGGLMLGIVDTAKDNIDIEVCKQVWKQLSKENTPASSYVDSLPSILSGGCGTGRQSIAFEKQLSELLTDLIGSD